MSISVAMATFNGKSYIEEQVSTILKCLSEGDELVISDAKSTDGTEEFLKKICKNFPQVRIVKWSNRPEDSVIRSVAANFVNAVNHCKNDIIVLSDQDDIWLHDRLDFVREAHRNSKCVCSVADALVVNEDRLNSHTIFQQKKPRTGFFRNLAKLTVLGCQLSFRKSALLPFVMMPNNSYITHDWWWYVMIQTQGQITFSKSPIFKYRRHADNVSAGLSKSQNPLLFRIYVRVVFLYYCIKFYIGKMG